MYVNNVKVNLQDYVKVKLNPMGKEIYFHQYDDTRKQYIESNGYYPACFQPEYPKVDEDGYSEFVLWEFMKLYGRYMAVGKPLPFDKD